MVTASAAAAMLRSGSTSVQGQVGRSTRARPLRRRRVENEPRRLISANGVRSPSG